MRCYDTEVFHNNLEKNTRTLEKLEKYIDIIKLLSIELINFF